MSLKKNAFYNMILTISNVIFPFITTPYVSRILGVENIGIVNFATTYSSYFVLLAALGIPIYGIREIAKRKNDPEGRNRVFSELFFINCLTCLVFSLVYIVTIFSVPALYQDRLFLFIAGITVLFVPLNTDWFFSGREQFKLVTIRSIAAKIISLVGLFIFVRTREDIVPYLILTVVANLSSQIWNFGYMLRKEVKFRFVNMEIKKHLKIVLILFASNIAISIYTLLNTLMLGFMSDYTQVGYYTSAIRVSKLILPVITALSPVIIARINTLKGEKNGMSQVESLINRSFGMMMFLAIPAAVGLIMIAPRFVPLFFGSEFIRITPSLQLLSLLIPIIGLSNLFGMQILIALGHEKRFLTAILCGTIISLCLNFILIPIYGSVGASIASVVSEITVTLTTSLFALRVISFRINTKNIIQPIIAALPIILISLCIKNILRHDLAYILITISMSALLYVFTMVSILKNEIAKQSVHSIIKKIRTRLYKLKTRL